MEDLRAALDSQQRRRLPTALLHAAGSGAHRTKTSRCVSLALLCVAQCSREPTPADDSSGSRPGADHGSTYAGSREAATPAPDTDGGAATRLDDPTLWEAVTPSRDPFAPWTPDGGGTCSGLAAWFPEGDWLEIDTGRCNYLTVEQPLRQGLPRGTRIAADVLHFDLTAPEPDIATLAVVVGGELVVETTVPIPSPANQFTVVGALEKGHRAGELIQFHLRNHGQNNWRLLRLQAAQ